MANSIKRATVALALAAGAGALTGCGTVPGQMANPLNAIQGAARSVAGGLVPSSAPGAAQASHQGYNNPNLQVDSRGVLFEVVNGQPALVPSRNPQACATAVVAQRRSLALDNQAAAADRYNANRTGAVIDSAGRRAAGAAEYGVRSGNTEAATRGIAAAATGGIAQVVTGIFSNAIRNQGVENTQDRSAAQIAELKQDCLQQAAQTCGSNGACFSTMVNTGRTPR